MVEDKAYAQMIPGWPCYAATAAVTSMQSRLAVCGKIIYLPDKDFNNFPAVNAFGIARVDDDEEQNLQINCYAAAIRIK